MVLLGHGTGSFLLLFGFLIVSSYIHENGAYLYEQDVKRKIGYCSDGRKRELVYTEKDGNCLFRSISYCLWTDMEHYAGVRRVLVDHVVQNWSTYALNVRHDHSKNSASDYRAYMSGDAVWGGESEIVAASEVYKCDFYIYDNVERYHKITTPGGEHVCALYYNGSHYFPVEDK